ncbi:MAG TPA: NAD(P)H-hydrate dehydratase [Candidatus Angelobacter sp.]|nr:NAD(P)H-hydrate dehydratase [Candidatus Angelobacter sp.]
MKALTAAEMREAERLINERYCISTGQLMQQAGKAVSDAVLAFLSRSYPSFRQDKNTRVAVLCGKGNNGGDGFVAACHLLQYATVRVYLFGSKDVLAGDPAENCRVYLEKGGTVCEVMDEAAWEKAWNEIVWADVVVDALLGTGLRDSPTGLIARTIESLNSFSRSATSPLPSLIVAVDIPSGLPSDGQAACGPVLSAHKTVTFIAPKIGQLVSPDAAQCGELLVSLIGSPPKLADEVGQGTLRWVGPDEFGGLPLIRRANAHKGTFGHVLLVAGSLGKSGAAVLAGGACLRAGAGLTTIATPSVVLPIVATAHPEYMTEPLASTEEGTAKGTSGNLLSFAKLLEGKTVLGIGPGLGTHRDTQQFIVDLVFRCELPIILDADGLNAFVGRSDLLASRKSSFLAITPHPGEMARLLGITTAEVEANRVKVAVEAAHRWNAYVVLKGFRTVLCSPEGQVWVNTMGSASLAKGGSGDVLTGVLAALTAQFGTRDWVRVLALGVYLHGAASQGSLGYEDESGPLASGIAYGIPMARHNLLREIRQLG